MKIYKSLLINAFVFLGVSHLFAQEDTVKAVILNETEIESGKLYNSGLQKFESGGELMDIPKKPATTRVKVLPLKKLKDFAV